MKKSSIFAQKNLTRPDRNIATSLLVTSFIIGLLPVTAIAQTNSADRNSPTGTNASGATASVDFKTLSTLDKNQLIMVIRCLIIQGVNSNEAIQKCLPLIVTPPPAPVNNLSTLTPTVKVIYPNGGERITEGKIVRVKYIASSSKSVDIRLWNANTMTSDIMTNLPNTGTFEWNVRAVAGYDADYAIGVRAKNANGSSYDVSDTYFRILKGDSNASSATSSTIRTIPSQGANVESILTKVKFFFESLKAN